MMKTNIGLIRKPTNLDFFKYSRIYFAVSLIIVTCSIIFSFVKGYNIGVDFKGGIVVDLKAITTYSNAKLTKELKTLKINDFSIKEFGDNKVQIIVSAQSVNSDEAKEIISTIKNQLKGYTFLQTQFVGPSISKDLIQGGIFAVIGSFLGIFAYLWVRYDWQYGLIGIITLIHDVMASLLFVSMFAFEVNIGSIAAILTIIGFSINDTVVLFDQVRENVKKYIKEDVKTIINRSINQVLSRSIATSSTVMLVLLSIFLLGGDTLESLSFTLLVGVFFGTYSSIFLAVILLYYIGNIKSKYLKKSNAVK